MLKHDLIPVSKFYSAIEYIPLFWLSIGIHHYIGRYL